MIPYSQRIAEKLLVKDKFEIDLTKLEITTKVLKVVKKVY